MQTSIAAWLNKPPAITEPPPARLSAKTPPPPRPQPVRELSASRFHTFIVDEECKSRTPDPAPPTRFDQDPTSPGPSTSRAPPALDPRITLRPCTKENVQSFKRLNSILLPIPYPSKFYDEILTEKVANSITLLAIWNDQTTSTKPLVFGSQSSSSQSEQGRVVGGIRCRLLGNSPPMLYISTLCVLSPYRSYGIATHLLQTILVRAVKEYGVKEVGAHVWEANEEGLLWYAKRGFREESKEEGYYRRLNPQGAVVLKRAVGVGDLLGT